MKTRAIEMYIGVGGDSGTWGTEYVEIPFDTEEKEIEWKAIEACKELYKDEDFQFCGVYSTPELDEEINNHYYYHIHVIGKNGFSTCLVTKNEHCDEMDQDNILTEACKDNCIDKDDIPFVDTIEEIDEDEFKEQFS